MKVSCVAFTHQGLNRSNNEDCLLCDGWIRNRPIEAPFRVLNDCSLSHTSVFAVADGLGGHSSGEIASEFVLSRITNKIAEPSVISEAPLTKLLQEVHSELFDLSSAMLAYRGMGSTVAGLVVDLLGKIHLFHVGDSRVYRREDRFLQLLTKDDRAEPQGYGEKDDHLPTSPSLLQCLGGLREFSQISPHVTSFEASEQPEVFLLCSDGLSDMLSQDEIEASMSDSHEEWILNLFARTCSAGALDNISILIIEVKPDSSLPAIAPQLEAASTEEVT